MDFLTLPLDSSATDEDCLSIIKIGDDAASSDPLVPLLWPNGPPIISPDPNATTTPTCPRQESIDQLHCHFSDTANTWFKVVDQETGETIAYTWWRFERGTTMAEWKENWECRWMPKGVNRELADAISGRRLLQRPRLLGEKPFYALKELYVLPEYQCKGIGGSLVARFVEKANELGLRAYIESTENGRALYLRHGFREVDRVTIDLGKYGGEKGKKCSFGSLMKDPDPHWW
ncbi:MAG: hypothetical protein M1834_004729 [Cirrosporium novae-zelandiae]|nr:MAG: hypothetical protein M1834_004729 [Cirrosporium novae-zelandiae]